MAITPRARDRYRRAVLATSSVLTVAAASAVGWVAGIAAEQTAAEQAAKAEPTGAAPAKQPGHRERTRHTVRSKVVWRDRPTRTEVTVRYATAPVASYDGTGGGVSAPRSSAPAPAAPAAPAKPAPAPAPAPAPQPAPPPVPSQGS